MESKNELSYVPDPGMRLYIGLTVFLLSFFMLPTGILLEQFIHVHLWKKLVVGLFWLSAPLMKISSVAILGKPSYLWIKSKFRHHFVRVVKPYHESRLRYNIGLIMFCLPIIPNYIMAYAPAIVSDHFHIRLIINLAIDAVFIGSLFVLGGDFWDKLKALFVFSARASFPQETEGKQVRTSVGMI
jgi:hypothetical protein